MGRRRPSDNDPFDLGRLSKSFMLAGSQMRGRMAEDDFRLGMGLQGREVRKIHKGGDFIEEYHTDMFGNRIRRSKPIVYEVKTGSSTLSEAQRRKKRQLGARFKEVRY